MSNPVRLAILRDFPEEHWPSMDLCAEMLLAEIGKLPDSVIRAQDVCAPYHWRFSKQREGGGGTARNIDRLTNRLWDYPRYARRNVARSFDLFHVVDHSYSQLVHALPADRTGVFCHDIDTFRCVLDPKADPRPRWFRAMARRILTGMQKAAIVFHTTDTVRREIEKHQLIDPEKLVKTPLGTSPEFVIDGPSAIPLDAMGRPILDLPNDTPFVLHVGSCIPRKRIDVLLEVFAALRQRRPDLRLVKVGGEWTDAQRQMLAKLNIADATIHVTGASRSAIAWLYRQSAVVVQPSEAEGFGLPVIEAIACGATVVASDIPALREVGGQAVTYCPVGDIDAWAETVVRILNDPDQAPRPAERLSQALKYSWKEHARIILEAYSRLV